MMGHSPHMHLWSFRCSRARGARQLGHVVHCPELAARRVRQRLWRRRGAGDGATYSCSSAAETFRCVAKSLRWSHQSACASVRGTPAAPHATASLKSWAPEGVVRNCGRHQIAQAIRVLLGPHKFVPAHGIPVQAMRPAPQRLPHGRHVAAPPVACPILTLSCPTLTVSCPTLTLSCRESFLRF